MPPRRPGAVTAAGVMAIIYGSLFTLCGVCGVVGMAAQDGVGGNPFGGADPAQEKVMKEVQAAIVAEMPAYESIQVIGTVVSLAESVALLIAGIGLLNMRRWARTLALIAAVVAIVTGVLQAGFQMAVVMPATSRALQKALPAVVPANAGPQAQQAVQAVRFFMNLTAVLTIAVMAVLAIYLLVIVILLCQRRVKAAFAAWDQAAFGEGQGGYDERDYRDRDDGEDEWRRPRREE